MASDGQIVNRNHQRRVGAGPSNDRKSSRVNKGGRPRIRAGEKSFLVSTSVPESIYGLIPAEKPEWLRQVIIEKLISDKLIEAPKGEKRNLENLSRKVKSQNRELTEKAKIRALFAEILKVAKVQAISEETKALQEKDWKLLLQ